MQLWLERFDSALGELQLVCDDQGQLRALDFEDYRERMERLLRLHYRVYRLDPGPAPDHVKQALRAYFAGELEALDDIVVATGGTPFQQRVWQALRTIAAGRTCSYADLARLIGQPGASRAVGMANGANPVALVVPCHRVIGANGALTGYGGGLWRKHWLLEHESEQQRLMGS